MKRILVAASAALVVLVTATDVSATINAPASAARAHCSAAKFIDYAKAVYHRPVVHKRALLRIQKLKVCLRPWATRFQRKLGRSRWARAHPWEAAWRAVPAWLKASLARLAYCESTNNPRAANGQYTGKYQYANPTWARAGGHGRAMDAPEIEQDVRTARFWPGHRGEWSCKA